MKFPACSVAILVGGGATRMGYDKARVEVQGVSMLRRVFRVAAALSTDILLIGNNAAAYADLAPSARCIPDYDGRSGARAPGAGAPGPGAPGPGAAGGPLSGIVAALTAAHHELVIVLAADLPFLDPTVLRFLLQRAVEFGVDAVIPVVESDRPESLHAVYRTTCLSAARAAVDTGIFRIAAIFPQVRVHRVLRQDLLSVTDDLRSFFNINTPEDLACTMTTTNSIKEHNE